MKKAPVFLGVYSRTNSEPGSAEAQRRWHVWSLESGQFVVQEVLPGRDKFGEQKRINSSEFFSSFRVHAAFSHGLKGQAPKLDANAAAKEAAQEDDEPMHQAKSIFEEMDDDDEPIAPQVNMAGEDGLYRMRPEQKKSAEAESAKSATYYSSKTPPQKSAPFVPEAERVEEKMRSDFSLAIIRLQSNRDMALESLNKILESRGNFRTEHKFMFSDFGTALRRRRLYSLAFRFHERAKELAPDDEHILFNMARAMFDSGKVDRARKYLQQAVAMSNDFQAGADFLEFIEGKYPHR